MCQWLPSSGPDGVGLRAVCAPRYLGRPGPRRGCVPSLLLNWGTAIGDRDLVAIAGESVPYGPPVRRLSLPAAPALPDSPRPGGFAHRRCGTPRQCGVRGLPELGHPVRLAAIGFMKVIVPRGISGNHRVTNARQRHLEPIPLMPKGLLSALAFNGIVNGAHQQGSPST